MAWIDERPNAYPDNFLPPHTDQFYPTKIPMYYDEDHRFNIDRALSKEDILKQSSSYPYLDTSKVTFADLPDYKRAHYEPDTDLSVLNLKHIDPQNITAEDLKTVGHETIHRTLNPKHGIPAASNLLKGSIEPYNQYSWEQEGPKRATDYLSEDQRKKNEHLLLYAIENLDNPEFDISKLDQSLYQGLFNGHDYHDALLDEVSEGLYGGFQQDPYYKPTWAEGFNAPGEVRRGYFGLRDLFDQYALKYKNIMKNYGRSPGPLGRARRPTPLGDASIAERIAAENKAKKNAAIKEAVNIQIGTSRGGDTVLPQQKPKTYVSPRPHGNGGQKGSMPTGTAGRNPWGRAHGGLIDIPLPGRSRYI